MIPAGRTESALVGAATKGGGVDVLLALTLLFVPVIDAFKRARWSCSYCRRRWSLASAAICAFCKGLGATWSMTPLTVPAAIFIN